LERFEAEVESSEISDTFSLSEKAWAETGGVLYTIDLKVEPNANGSLTLLRRIHDNNTSKFSVLEERMIIA